MKQKDFGFFKKMFYAIGDFDKYKIFANEELFTSIKYLLKLMLIFVIIATIAITIKTADEVNKGIQVFKEDFPEFKIENNILTIEGDNKQFIKGDSEGIYGLIIDSESDDINNIKTETPYQVEIAFLKDKIVLKNSNNVEENIKYENLAKNYDLNNINKQSILNLFSDSNLSKLYLIFALISFLTLFVSYLIKFLIDILLLSIVGFLLSKIVGVNFKYKSIFNMSIYALTLSIILSLIYSIVNLFTGFIIQYFEIAYNAISYIYIVTALLMIKTDLMKNQQELIKIVQEQRKIKEEEEQNKEENKNDEEDKQKEEKQEEKEEKNKEGKEETPEGSNA